MQNEATQTEQPTTTFEYRLTGVEARAPFEERGERYGFGLAVSFANGKTGSVRQLGLYIDPGMTGHEVAAKLEQFANVLRVRLPSPIEPTSNTETTL